MKLLRSRSLGLCLLAMVLVLAIIATLLGASTAFQNSGWLILMGLALFVLAGMPSLRDLMGPSPSESPGVERRSSGRRNSNSLVAVSAAAILAVYAAGYGNNGLPTTAGARGYVSGTEGFVLAVK